MINFQSTNSIAQLRRTFLSHFPTKDLPSHFFPRPGRNGDTSFLCGWVTTWDKIAVFVAKEHPAHLEREFDDDKLSPVDPIYTTVMFTPHLAELCDVPTLIIRSSWAGPRPSQMLPVVAIYTNNTNSENRDRIDGSAGVKKLKEVLDLEGPPVWVVDTENKYWPKYFESLSLYLLLLESVLGL